jgi:DHA2 family multidrug resistance protein-like MFS transporter
MDLTVLELAMPKLSADVEPTSSQLLWIMDIYGFLLAGFLITMGTLGDRSGRRQLRLIGAAAFGVASVLAAFSRSAEMLIAARALLTGNSSDVQLAADLPTNPAPHRGS